MENRRHFGEIGHSYDDEKLMGKFICHSPLPDWIADAGELVLGADMGAPQDSRKGILAINSNSN